MKKNLLKTLLVGVMTLMATGAWAGDKTVVKYSFDDATSPALTAGSRVTLDYSHTSVITKTPFLNMTNNNNGAAGSSTISLGSQDLSGETWTLTFEWAANGGCNGKTGHTYLKAGDTNLFDIVDNSNWNTANQLTYGSSSVDLSVPGCNKSNRFTITTADLYNTTDYWYHFVITGSDGGVKLTITNSSSGTEIVKDAVLSETNVSPTSIVANPSCGGALGFDELSLTYYVEGEVIQTPLANYTAVDGISRTITATCDTEGATLYYSTDGENWTEGAVVTVSESGNVYFKAVKGTSESDVLTFEAVAGEAIVLNAPVIDRTSNTSVTISCDQTSLLLSPTATIYYTYGEESGSFTGSKTLTVAADATITAYAVAEGYTNSETTERAVALFPVYVEQIENAASKTSGWSTNAFSEETITASERTYAALMLDGEQWGENVYFQTDGAWGFRASGNWYINSDTEESWLLMPNMKKGDVVVVDITYPASSMVNATYSKYAYGNRHAYEVTEDGNVELAFKKINASTMDYIYGVYAYREVEVTPKNIYLAPAIWNVEDATERYAVYAFNSSTTYDWFDFAETGEEGTFTAAVPDFFNKIILVRMNGETTENNWDNKWNQTDDIDFTTVADGTVFTITGWGEGEGANSTYEATTPEPVVEDVYTIAGTEDLTGYDWDATQNQMTLNEETGLYEWSSPETVKVTTEIFPKFKVVKNGTDWYPEGDESTNWVITPGVFGSNVSTGGEGYYNISITFNPETKEIAVKGYRASRLTYTVVGAFKAEGSEEEEASFFGTKWDATNGENDLEWDFGGHFKLEKFATLGVGTVLFKIAKEHSMDVTYGVDGKKDGGNIEISIDKEGIYGFTFWFDPDMGDGEGARVSYYLTYSDPATGINTVATAAQQAVVYNMAGQRVMRSAEGRLQGKNAQKGLYIVNGKKVVMK